MSPRSMALAVFALAFLIAMLTENVLIATLFIALGFGVALLIAGVSLMASGLSNLCKTSGKRR